LPWSLAFVIYRGKEKSFNKKDNEQKSLFGTEV